MFSGLDNVLRISEQQGVFCECMIVLEKKRKGMENCKKVSINRK